MPDKVIKRWLVSGIKNNLHHDSNGIPYRTTVPLLYIYNVKHIDKFTNLTYEKVRQLFKSITHQDFKFNPEDKDLYQFELQYQEFINIE